MSFTSLPARPVLPSARVRPLARESGERLSQFAGDDLEIMVSHSNEKIILPKEAVRVLVDVLSQLGEGNAVTIVPYHAELTTQEAAEFLGVSRPFVIKELEAGNIAFRNVGTHRRILLDDLVEYKHEARHKRRKALDELSALDQEMGLQ